MKERLILDFEGNVKGKKELCKVMESLQNFDFDLDIERKTERTPETWEELTDMCKIYIGDKCRVQEDCIKIKSNEGWLCFEKCGEMIHEPLWMTLAKKRTPAQMWQIIQGLM